MNVRIVQTCGEPLRSVDAPLQKGFKPVAKQILVTSRWSETHIAFSHPDVSQFITRSTGESRTGPDGSLLQRNIRLLHDFLEFRNFSLEISIELLRAAADRFVGPCA